MTKREALQLFQGRKVRTVWNEQEEKWYFCVTDVVEALTDSTNPTDYIKKMRKRDPMLAEGWGQIVTPLPFQTQGGKQITDIITREWSGLSTKEYKQFKGLRKGNLRDNMTNLEIALNTLAEASAAELSKQRDPQGFNAQKQIAKDGGSVAKVARDQLESQLGRSVISSEKAEDFLPPTQDVEELPEG